MAQLVSFRERVAEKEEWSPPAPASKYDRRVGKLRTRRSFGTGGKNLSERGHGGSAKKFRLHKLLVTSPEGIENAPQHAGGREGITAQIKEVVINPG